MGGKKVRGKKRKQRELWEIRTVMGFFFFGRTENGDRVLQKGKAFKQRREKEREREGSLWFYLFISV